MPDWRENKLVVRGEKSRIKEFKEMARGEGTDLSLDKMHPMPKVLQDTAAHHDRPNWYDWRNTNWGTKWDVTATLVLEEEGHLEYEFSSAWSPPEEWMRKVAKDYPALYFLLEVEDTVVSVVFERIADPRRKKDRFLDIT